MELLCTHIHENYSERICYINVESSYLDQYDLLKSTTFFISSFFRKEDMYREGTHNLYTTERERYYVKK